MGSRKISFANEQFYHVFNRGVDKRDIILDHDDLMRFIQSMSAFNKLKPIGSIYEQSFHKTKRLRAEDALVEFICYAVNPNHFHFLIKQFSDRGIEKFMQRLGTGFTKYFNGRYYRSGRLFQDKFKAKHVDSNEYLLHLSAYINLNHRVHQLGSKASKLWMSSWPEYQKIDARGLCQPDSILGQFKNLEEYRGFAEDAIEIILENRERQKELAEEWDLEALLPSPSGV